MHESLEYRQQLRDLRRPGGASLLIRVDFSDDEGWNRAREAVTAPVAQPGGAEFQANLQVVNDERFEGLTPAILVDGNSDMSLGIVAFLVDGPALVAPYAVMAVDLASGQTVRVHPSHVWLIENNVAGGNAHFADIIEGNVVDHVFQPSPAQLPTAEHTPKIEPRPSAAAMQKEAARKKALKRTRQKEQRAGLDGDEELERVAEATPGLIKLSQLDLGLLKALVRLSAHDQRRIAQWCMQAALEHAGIADDPDIIDAIDAAQEKWYALDSTKTLAAKYRDRGSSPVPGASTAVPQGPYPPPKNVAIAAVMTITASAFPVPDVGLFRTLDAACSTFGPQAPVLQDRLREQFGALLATG